MEGLCGTPRDGLNELDLRLKFGNCEYQYISRASWPNILANMSITFVLFMLFSGTSKSVVHFKWQMPMLCKFSQMRKHHREKQGDL